jgi:hypothetical protein
MINRKKKGNEPQQSEINGQRYENVQMFNKLVSLVINKVETELKVRIIADNMCYQVLCHLVKNIHITHSLTVGLHQTLRPNVTYDAISWKNLTSLLSPDFGIK